MVNVVSFISPFLGDFSTFRAVVDSFPTERKLKKTMCCGNDVTTRSFQYYVMRFQLLCVAGSGGRAPCADSVRLPRTQ